MNIIHSMWDVSFNVEGCYCGWRGITSSLIKEHLHRRVITKQKKSHREIVSLFSSDQFLFRLQYKVPLHRLERPLHAPPQSMTSQSFDLDY